MFSLCDYHVKLTVTGLTIQTKGSIWTLRERNIQGEIVLLENKKRDLLS